ncbi:MAG: hypothetical protein ACR2M5_12430, partial [Nakamurella sp.]
IEVHGEPPDQIEGSNADSQLAMIGDGTCHDLRPDRPSAARDRPIVGRRHRGQTIRVFSVYAAADWLVRGE